VKKIARADPMPSLNNIKHIVVERLGRVPL